MIDTVSCGTISDDRACAIDGARDMLANEARMIARSCALSRKLSENKSDGDKPMNEINQAVQDGTTMDA